ncbi:hypothetical protein DYB31_001018 [Aphanomyces astaci]|uniref:Uncharacterized protein n=1 Tax=Aphanomyces astaci TaxID=112090 RepID=A0A397ELD0_APHAT|nr:hypothetical protein DYB31_001018 [Aphanomyces astaci]
MSAGCKTWVPLSAPLEGGDDDVGGGATTTRVGEPLRCCRAADVASSCGEDDCWLEMTPDDTNILVDTDGEVGGSSPLAAVNVVVMSWEVVSVLGPSMPSSVLGSKLDAASFICVAIAGSDNDDDDDDLTHDKSLVKAPSRDDDDDVL